MLLISTFVDFYIQLCTAKQSMDMGGFKLALELGNPKLTLRELYLERVDQL